MTRYNGWNQGWRALALAIIDLAFVVICIVNGYPVIAVLCGCVVVAFHSYRFITWRLHGDERPSAAPDRTYDAAA